MTSVSADQMETTGQTSADKRYTTVAIILHWVIAAAIAFQMVGGKWMVSQGDSATGAVFTIFQIHKTVGLTILGLTLARIIWRLANRAPALPAGMTGFERFAASITHVGFYGFLILVPLSGWAMASVSPTGVPTFFLMLDALPFAHLPILAEADLAARHDAEVLLKQAHNYLSIAMGLLIALHIAAALKHQFIARDNLIARMVVSASTQPNSIARASVGGVAAAATLMFLLGGIVWGLQQKGLTGQVSTAALATAPVSAGAWIVDQEQSALGFTITYTGNAVAGSIGNWSADIVFDPSDLEGSSATITIDMASVTLADATLQAQSSGGDGFDLANHATATYVANAFTVSEDGSFQAEGALTLRGITAEVPLAFTFNEENGIATVSGSATLNRLDFAIGAIGAANEAWLLYGVDIAFDLVAERP